jgi:hypothetical protein
MMCARCSITTKVKGTGRSEKDPADPCDEPDPKTSTTSAPPPPASSPTVSVEKMTWIARTRFTGAARQSKRAIATGREAQKGEKGSTK